MTQSFRIDLALSKESQKKYELVAILVEENLLEDINTYNGLRTEYSQLNARTLKQRIERYAQDVQKSLPLTKTIIIKVKPNEDPYNISTVLEKLYFEGEDPHSTNEITRLVGTVLIGDIPIPVVNKNGNQFLSMFPYTDFEEKAYIYNSNTLDFELNNDARKIKPEIWHGVISSPVSTRTKTGRFNPESYNILAKYLDKNHMFHSDAEGFSTFDQKMLFTDTITEQNAINPLTFKNYQRYTDHIEDLSYNRFTKELAKELYVEMNGQLQGGDGIDNDGDCTGDTNSDGIICGTGDIGVDEDPINGIDDDNDGLIDEDDGDPENFVDNDQDGLLNEDGRDDNNADNDKRTDEDGPGDMDGDGCPGECGKDDDRDCKDIDKDTIPSYFENMMEDSLEETLGSTFINNNPEIVNAFNNAYDNPRIPFPPLTALMWSSGIIPPFNPAFCTDEPPNLWEDSCYEKDHEGDLDYFHPEWDDDEDGKCDEDGTADNDNDNDGLFDEDHGDINDTSVDTNYFDLLPDIQSKNMIEQYLKKYYELFEKHQGDINAWTNNTGRYSSARVDKNGLNRNDTDTLISLISKKDEFVKNYLRAQNQYLEGKIDNVVDNIQQDIKIIGRSTVGVAVFYDHDNDDSTDDILATNAFNFINHGIKQQNMDLTPYVLGKPANKISNAIECSLYAGTFNDGTLQNDGSKIVETNRVYDPNTSGIYDKDSDDDDEKYPDNLKDGDDFGGCFGNNAENRDWCFPDNSKGEIRSMKGTRAVAKNIPVDYRSCYDFKEAENFAGPPNTTMNYLYYAENMSDVTWKLLENGKYHSPAIVPDPGFVAGIPYGTQVGDEDEFIEAVEYFKNRYLLHAPIDAKQSPYTPMKDLIVVDDPIADIKLTMADIIESAGFDPEDNTIVSEFFLSGETTNNTLINIAPQISKVEFSVLPNYVDETPLPNGDPVLTINPNLAHSISSVVTHKEPTNDTIMQQVEAKFTLDLPIDSPRYTTFKGQDGKFQKIIYPNLFKYDSVESFADGLKNIDDKISKLPGASSYTDILSKAITTELNQEMIQDAIEWLNMSIDEKHNYMLTTYLSQTKESYITQPQNGYEIMYLIGEGDSTSYEYSFNGDIPEVEEDIAFNTAKDTNKAALESVDNALSEQIYDDSNSGVHINTDAVPLFEWVDAMAEWVEGLSEETSFGDPQMYCGNIIEIDKAAEPDYDNDGIPDNEDENPFSSDINNDNIPDGANSTNKLIIQSDKNIIEANGSEEVIITIKSATSTMSGYELNPFDSFSEIKLEILGNENNDFSLISNNPQKLINGNAQFKLVSSMNAGSIRVRADRLNNKLSSQSIGISSIKERVKLLTYNYESVNSKITYEEEQLENIIIKRDENNIVARLNTDNGELKIIDSNYTKQFIPNKGGVQSHIIITRKEDAKQIAKINLVSDDFELKNINNKYKVQEKNGIYEVFDNDQNKIALINPSSSLALDNNYIATLIDNKINAFRITNINGDNAFDLYIKIDLNKIGIKLLEQNEVITQNNKAQNEQNKLLSSIVNFIIPNALATININDTDKDQLNDYEEFTIKTSIENPDSDSDGFSDSQEIFSGYNPLLKNSLLFSDIEKSHNAFDAIIELYLRGILTGFNDGTFKPNNNLTREEFTKINLGAACIDCTNFAENIKNEIKNTYLQSPFPDKNISPELYYCVAKSKNDDIVSGYLGGPYKGFFIPQNKISRAEATKVLLETAEVDVKPYMHNNKPWYYTYIKSAKAYSLYPKAKFMELDHFSEERFNTWFDLQLKNHGEFISWLESPISRAEFAMMVQNLFQIKDCRNYDSDNDGLSNNSEKYQYGTDPLNPDTDEGGITDLQEVIHDMDPLNNSDEDNFKEFTPVNFDELDLTDDSDNDGLSNLEELECGTNPEKADSDNDGVNDLDEKILGTCPSVIGDEDLNVTDDNTLNIKGYFIEKEVVSVRKDNGESYETSIKQPISKLPANGEDSLILEAQILDKDGHLNFNDNKSTIEFTVEDDQFAVIETRRIRVHNGIAKTNITSTTTAGDYHVSAHVINNNIANNDKTILIHALDPVSIEMHANSSVLQAGILSTITINTLLKDQYNNIANNDTYEMMFTIEGPATIQNKDENTNRENLQLYFVEGKREIQIVSTENAGDIKLIAELINKQGEIIATENINLKSEKEINLELTHTNPNLIANNNSKTEIQVVAKNEEGDILTGFNGIVSLNVNDTSRGKFMSNPEIQMKNGRGSIILKTGLISGDVFIDAKSPGTKPGNIPVTIKPLAPEFLTIDTDKNTLYVNEDDSITLTIKTYDKYGNFVDKNNTTSVVLSITENTDKFGELETTTPIRIQNGIATTKLYPKDITGPINIVVNDVTNKVKPTTLTINTKMRFDYEDVQNSNPNVLFASLLGTNAGDITQENNLASWMAFSGKTESVISLLANPNGFAKLSQIKNNGVITNTDNTYLYTKIIAANNKNLPTRFAIKDLITDKTLADVFLKTIPSKRMYTNIQKPTPSQQGIFLNKLTEDPKLDTKKFKGNLSLTYNEAEVISITNLGQINIIDDAFEIILDENDQYIRMKINMHGILVAELIYNFTFYSDIKILDTQFNYNNYNTLTPGVYIVPHFGISNYAIEKNFNGNSSKNPAGYAIIDTNQELPSNQAPGSTILTLDNAHNKKGIGFENDNKHILLFAAGATSGEAFMDNTSEIGILLGDPTIKLKPSEIRNSGFTSTIGEKILQGNKLINDITIFDYDNDGLDDILTSYKDGEIKLIQNKESGTRFENLGALLNIKNGIISMDVGDFDNNGYEDILIAANESCKSDEEICVDLYQNYEGKFIRKHLELKIDSQIHMLKVADAEGDEDPDIYATDGSGNIWVFYNNNGEIDLNGSLIGNLGVKIDPAMNLKSSLWISYDNQLLNNRNSSIDDNKFRTLSITNNNGFAAGASTDYLNTLAKIKSEKQIELAKSNIKEEHEFIILEYDDNFFSSTKYAMDINEGIAKPNDIIEYKINLKNSSETDYSNIIISDVVPNSMTLDKNSITCENCGDEYIVEFTNTLSRPFVIRNINLNSGENAKIIYQATLNNIPKVNITLGKNLADFPKDDDYIDIAASPEGNTSGIMTYFYSDYLTHDGIKYSKKVFYPSVEDKKEATQPPAHEIDLTQDFDIDADTVPDDVANLYNEITVADDDNDGLPNQWDSFAGDLSILNFTLDLDNTVIGDVLDQSAAIVEDAISALTCGGGCVAMPVNISFLTPGNFNVFGIPVGFDNGTPLFGWGVPGVGACTGAMCESSLGGRTYLSPTLNGGLVFALCLGPKAAGQCFTVNIPLLQALGVCDAINGAVDSVMSEASNIVSSVSGLMSMSLGGGSNASGSTANNDSGMVSYNLDNYSVQSSTSVNVRIPGFPSVFTDWIDRQTEEFGDLLDLPDIYFIYPDPQSMVGTFAPAQNDEIEIDTLYDALNFMNSLPLFNIETDEVVLKLPAITQVEIEQFRQDAQRFVSNMKSQVDTYKNYAEGNNDPDPAVAQAWASKEGQDFINNLEKFIESIEKNSLVLEEYTELPDKIMEYRFATTKYVTQIICYIDAVMNYSGGYVIRNKNRVKAWTKSIQNVVESVATWKDLLQLSISYQESCDKCTTSRQSLMELMMKIFVFIPSPPIIDLPKWPDIVIDISQIQGGVTVYFPDLKIVPEPITLPEIPRIYIPQNMPAEELIPYFKLFEFPEIGVLPDPPNLPDLPDLPGLPLPNLPDIPPPPDFPELPDALSVTAKGLEKIIKIVCLVKNGFIPTPETSLKTKVEELTARSSDLILPIDQGFAIETPDLKIDFVDRVEINTKVNLNLDITQTKDAVHELVDKFNIITGSLSDIANQGVNLINEASSNATDLSSNLSSAADSAVDSVSSAADSAADSTVDSVSSAADKETDERSDTDSADIGPTAFKNNQYPEITKSLEQITDIIDLLTIETANYNEQAAQIPNEIKLTAEMQWLDKNDPLLNRHLNEIQIATFSKELNNNKYLSELNNVKHGLISYVNNIDQNNQQLKDNINIENITRMYAANGNSQFLKPTKNIVNIKNNYLPSEDQSFENAKTTLNNMYDKTVTLKDNWLYDRMITSTNSAITTANANPSGEILHKGVFIYNKEKGISEKLFNYTKESKNRSSLAISDFDKDKDEDIIFSLGSDLYFKENFNKEEKKEYYNKPPKTYNLDQLMPNGPSVNMFRVINTENNKITTAWHAATDIIAYEIEMKESLNDIYSTKTTKTDRILVVPKEKKENTVNNILPEADLKIIKGNVNIESSIAKENTLVQGDLVNTENNSTVLINFINGSDNKNQIKLEENSTFVIPDLNANAQQINITGEATILSGTNILSRPGTILGTDKDSKLNVNFDNREKIILKGNSTFTIPTITKTKTTLSSNSGDIQVLTTPRTRYSKGEKLEFKKNQLLHTIGITTLELTSKTNGEAIIKLNSNSQFIIPNTLPNDTVIKIKQGNIEIININEEPILMNGYYGMLLTKNSIIETIGKGKALIKHDTLSTQLNSNESLRIQELINIKSPHLNIELPNGNYYSRIRSVNQDGEKSTYSRTILFSPQICGDTTAPLASTGSATKKVPIFKTLEINGESSIDINGKISEYYFDLDLERDTDHDGDKTNDVESYNDLDKNIDSDNNGNPANDKDDSIISVGPFQDLEPRYIKMWVKDESGNVSSQEVKIEIYVPDIILSPVSAENGIIQGYTEPRESQMPFRIIRNRDGIIDTIKKEDGSDVFYTDQDGNYFIDDLKTDEEIIVLDANGNIIATLDEQTGRLFIKNDNYKLIAEKASETMPTRVNMVNKSGEIILTTFLIPEVNTDVSIDENINFSGEILEQMIGVHIKEGTYRDTLNFRKIPTNDVLYPGGVEILQNNERLALIATNGNIYLFNEDLKLQLKSSEDIKAPYVLEIKDDQEILADVYISTFDGNGVLFDYTIGDPNLIGKLNMTNEKKQNINDKDYDQFPDEYELRHQLDPLNPDRDKDKDNDGLTNSEEFNLGTNPNNSDTDQDGISDYNEIIQNTDPVVKNISPFADISKNDVLYNIIYKFYNKNIIEGFTINDRKLFKPTKPISRAEFTKIMLEILCIEPRPEAYKQPAVFNDILFDEAELPWFYSITKESFFRNFITGYLNKKDNNNLTPFKPNQTINYAETAKIIEEVLSRFITKTGETVLKGIENVKAGTPWYKPYLEIAKDLSKYVNLSENIKNAFILTEDETLTPDKKLTRYKFIEIADRVLNIYDCRTIDPNLDSNNDGISDLDAMLNGIDGFNNDPDNDGLTNDQEQLHSTDPFNPDTDYGGVFDGEEIDRGSNPLNPVDDFPTEDNIEDLTNDNFTNADETANTENPGTHIVVPACIVCPCPVTIENSADIAKNDIVFTAITNIDNSKVFTTSETVKFNGK